MTTRILKEYLSRLIKIDFLHAIKIIKRQLISTVFFIAKKIKKLLIEKN